MLERSAVMPLLLEACPSFVESWTQHLAAERFDEDPLFIDLAALARHLVTLAAAPGAHDAELTATFAVVERMQIEGDDYVQEAAVVGLLEGVQFATEHADVGTERITRHLGPASAAAWRDLDAFWSRLADRAQRVA